MGAIRVDASPDIKCTADALRHDGRSPRSASLSDGLGQAPRVQTEPALGSSRESAAQDLAQDDGVVVLAVVGGVHEGERAFSRPTPECSQLPTTPAQLVDIAAAELVKTLRRMPEPLAQLRAGRHVLLPRVESGALA